MKHEVATGERLEFKKLMKALFITEVKASLKPQKKNPQVSLPFHTNTIETNSVNSNSLWSLKRR